MPLPGVTTLLVCVGVFAIFRLVRPLTIINQLLRQRFWKPRTRLVKEDEVPSYVRDGFREPIAELQALGFELIGWIALGNERSGRDVPRFCARLFHAETRAYVDVAFALLPNPTAPCTTSFSTYGVDRVVRTYPGERPFFGEPAGTIVAEPFAPTIALQWDAHRAAVRDAGVVPAELDHEAILARGVERQAAWFASLVDKGTFVAAEDSAYVLSWRAALSRYRTMKRPKSRLAAQQAARASTLKPVAMVPLEEEVAAYQRSVDQSSGRPRASFLALLFCVSVALFIAGGTYVMGTARTAIVVVAVVLFHELGHYLAMRAFGYVDTTIFFVPFLGGIATGRKDDATIRQRMIVLLAGPLPGLLLALALVGRGAWPRDVVLILAGINFFNLLPILPLDGGQIAHLLLFARRPWLDVAFRAVAGVALLLIAVVTSFGIFFAVLGIVTLVRLPKALRQAQLQRHFRELRAQWPETPRTLLFFRMLRASPQAAAPFLQKVALARQTLAHAAADVVVKVGSRLGWLLSYGAVFAVGCFAIARTFGSPLDPRLAPRKPSEPVIVSVLRCPTITSRSPVRPESSWSSSASLGAIATFPNSAALAAARPAVVAAAPSAATRDLDTALFVWTTPFDDVDDSPFGDRSQQHARRIAPIADAVKKAGGRFHDLGWPPSVNLDCAAADEAAAQRIEETLEEYAVALRHDIAIPAPWDAETAPTEALALARRTFRIAMTAANTVHEEPARLSSVFGLLIGGTGAVKSHVQKRQERRAQEAAAALAAERAKGPIDEEVAHLVTTSIATISIDERDRVTAELRARLGATEPEARPGVAFAVRSWRDGTRLRVVIGHANPKQFDSSVRPMISWLCAQSCVDVRLAAEQQ